MLPLYVLTRAGRKNRGVSVLDVGNLCSDCKSTQLLREYRPSCTDSEQVDMVAGSPVALSASEQSLSRSVRGIGIPPRKNDQSVTARAAAAAHIPAPACKQLLQRKRTQHPSFALWRTPTPAPPHLNAESSAVACTPASELSPGCSTPLAPGASTTSAGVGGGGGGAAAVSS